MELYLNKDNVKCRDGELGSGLGECGELFKGKVADQRHREEYQNNYK